MKVMRFYRIWIERDNKESIVYIAINKVDELSKIVKKIEKKRKGVMVKMIMDGYGFTP
jgi:hypothetical protein